MEHECEWYFHVVRDTPTPTVDAAAHEQQPSVPDDESTVTAQAVLSLVALPTRGEEGGPGRQRGSFVSLPAASWPAH